MKDIQIEKSSWQKKQSKYEVANKLSNFEGFNYAGRFRINCFAEFNFVAKGAKAGQSSKKFFSRKSIPTTYF